MTKESMAIRCAAAINSIELDAVIIAKNMKVSPPEIKIKKHRDPEMRAMLILEFSAELFRMYSGRVDEKPKPEVDPFDGITSGMMLRNKKTREYGECFARYMTTVDGKAAPMFKIFFLDETGNRVERRMARADCETMNDKMIVEAKEAAKKTAEKEATEQAVAEKKAAIKVAKEAAKAAK